MDNISLFVKENNLLKATISLSFSSIAYELIHSFGTHIISPLLDINRNNKKDMDEIKNLKIKVLNKYIHVGMFIHTLIKFITIIVILYFINKYLK